MGLGAAAKNWAPPDFGLLNLSDSGFFNNFPDTTSRRVRAKGALHLVRAVTDVTSIFR